MTLDQLRIFVVVANLQHITRAAGQLNLTQSAVSSAISTLELRHDVRLFDRVGRSIVLNQVGQAFLHEAKAVLARAAAAEAALDDLGGLKRGRLSVYASRTISSYWLPARLVKFRAMHPGIEVEVAIGNTADVVQALIDGAAELGFVEGEVDEPVLARRQVGADELVVVVGAGHPWAARTTILAVDLVQTAWVLREVGSGTRSAFESAIALSGLTPGELDITLTLPGNEAVLSAVEAGAGATAISAQAAAPGLRCGSLHQLAFDLPTRPYYLLRHKERYRSKAGDAFLEISPP
ncbi:MAG: LysR family transcriptional regulator [Caulobacteraceae bacterium]